MQFVYLLFKLDSQMYEITEEMIFNLPGWQAELAKHTWAKQTRSPGRQETEEKQFGQIDYKIDKKVYK